jgi:hypothetical protein
MVMTTFQIRVSELLDKGEVKEEAMRLWEVDEGSHTVSGHGLIGLFIKERIKCKEF